MVTSSRRTNLVNETVDVIETVIVAALVNRNAPVDMIDAVYAQASISFVIKSIPRA